MPDRTYIRPLVQMGPARPGGALPLSNTGGWFTHAELLSRNAPPRIVPAAQLTEDQRGPLTAPRAPLGGLSLDVPRLMAILNVTPDSFSDGGLYDAPEAAIAGARRLISDGADILDIGGESTRPGARPVPPDEETARVLPVFRAIAGEWGGLLSTDTRNAATARAVLAEGAGLLNDVSAMTHDPAMTGVAAAAGKPVCLMHAQGDPQVMQDAPAYGNVVLDVYDALAQARDAAIAAGIAPERIVLDPGIGFGKTLAHNLALIGNLSLFHSLGCALLLGVSRKRFIGTLAGVETAAQRMPGSVAVGLAGLAQGVQILRVHDLAETRQAVTLWRASIAGAEPREGKERETA